MGTQNFFLFPMLVTRRKISLIISLAFFSYLALPMDIGLSHLERKGVHIITS